jgi:hypothetical protein
MQLRRWRECGAQVTPEATTYDVARQVAEAQGTPLKVRARWCHWAGPTGERRVTASEHNRRALKATIWPACLRHSRYFLRVALQSPPPLHHHLCTLNRPRATHVLSHHY